MSSEVCSPGTARSSRCLSLSAAACLRAAALHWQSWSRPTGACLAASPQTSKQASLISQLSSGSTQALQAAAEAAAGQQRHHRDLHPCQMSRACYLQRRAGIAHDRQRGRLGHELQLRLLSMLARAASDERSSSLLGAPGDCGSPCAEEQEDRASDLAAADRG